MCGFVSVFNISQDAEQLRSQVLSMAKKLRHRGPDWSGIYSDDQAILAHERLAIVDPQSGRQPLSSKDGNLVLAVNGEIYNHRQLRSELSDYQFQTGSDCEVILALYQKFGVNFLNKLRGMFAFALYDKSTNKLMIARDHIGIIPLYYGHDQFGQLYAASELKALEGICNQYDVFPPGHYLIDGSEKVQKWYEPQWTDFEQVKDKKSSIEQINVSLKQAIHSHLMSDVPYGVLLSGGLDSSIVSAIAKQYAAKRVESDDQNDAWWPQLHSFAVGLEDSPDLIAAKKVADYIGTVHHEVHFTLQEGLDALRDVIYHLETYDVTTVRASTPMYLLARVIKSMGIKMVLSGEGSDELFGGYLYFHKAPDARAFHEETVRKLSKLYLYDCLRANKALSAWGVEGRVPFLDYDFINVAMTLNPNDKMVTDGIEKWILRKAFETDLPKEIVWRQKEQFSDGVGYGWIDQLKAHAAEQVTDEQLSSAAYRFPINPPQSKEEYFYRSIFTEHFPSDAAAKTVPSVPSVACSTAEALAWDESFKNQSDPSGRAVKTVHQDSY
ncbi:MAG: asparagine synthase B [Calditrichaeota bacterium]|nr:asparagine synthase B [Calditrichota bacterium]